MRIVGAVLLVLVATVEAGPDTALTPFPKARLLCSQHVTGNTMHITWTSHASEHNVDLIVRHYEKATKRVATRGAKGEMTLAWDRDTVLSVYPATKNDDFPHCETKPKAGEKSVILISRAARGKDDKKPDSKKPDDKK